MVTRPQIMIEILKGLHSIPVDLSDDQIWTQCTGMTKLLIDHSLGKSQVVQLSCQEMEHLEETIAKISEDILKQISGMNLSSIEDGAQIISRVAPHLNESGHYCFGRLVAFLAFVSCVTDRVVTPSIKQQEVELLSQSIAECLMQYKKAQPQNNTNWKNIAIASGILFMFGTVLLKLL